MKLLKGKWGWQLKKKIKPLKELEEEFFLLSTADDIFNTQLDVDLVS